MHALPWHVVAIPIFMDEHGSKSETTSLPVVTSQKVDYKPGSMYC